MGRNVINEEVRLLLMTEGIAKLIKGGLLDLFRGLTEKQKKVTLKSLPFSVFCQRTKNLSKARCFLSFATPSTDNHEHSIHNVLSIT